MAANGDKLDAQLLPDDLSQVDALAMDYETKVLMLQRVAQELLGYQSEYARIAGRQAEIKANITVLREVKSALQTAIRAEQ